MIPLSVLLLSLISQIPVVAESLPPCEELHEPIVESTEEAPLQVNSVRLGSAPPSLEVLLTNTLDEPVVEIRFKLTPPLCATWHHQPSIVGPFPTAAGMENRGSEPLLEAQGTDRFRLPISGLIRLCQIGVSWGCDISEPATFELEGFKTASGRTWRLDRGKLRPVPVTETSSENVDDQ